MDKDGISFDRLLRNYDLSKMDVASENGNLVISEGNGKKEFSKQAVESATYKAFQHLTNDNSKDPSLRSLTNNVILISTKTHIYDDPLIQSIKNLDDVIRFSGIQTKAHEMGVLLKISNFRTTDQSVNLTDVDLVSFQDRLLDELNKDPNIPSNGTVSIVKSNKDEGSMEISTKEVGKYQYNISYTGKPKEDVFGAVRRDFHVVHMIPGNEISFGKE